MSSNLFYSTVDLPCPCQTQCHQHLPNAWYYQNGLIFDFELTDLIGRGGEGAVFEGHYHGNEAAFKMVEIKGLAQFEKLGDGVKDLRSRLSEMEMLSKSKGPNILPFFTHIR